MASSSSSSRFLLALLQNFLLLTAVAARRRDDVSFGETYTVTYGNDHVKSWNNGKVVQLTLDQSSGAGFASKKIYGSGLFHMRIKLPPKDSAGVVTAFYLTSNNKNHDELDFEFLGNREGKPSRLQTNVFINGRGGREQRIRLWFDPTADFHSYKILWNSHQTVFYVDDIPIRVVKNKRGVQYPKKAMRVQGSVWNGDSWATDGGKTKIDWSHAPFKSQFQGFRIDGCPASSKSLDCHSRSAKSGFWWNQKQFWGLDAKQRRAYKNVRNKYMYYDYCRDTKKHPVRPKECY